MYGHANTSKEEVDGVHKKELESPGLKMTDIDDTVCFQRVACSLLRQLLTRPPRG